MQKTRLGKYDMFYILLGLIIVGLIINLWFPFLDSYDSTMIGVYVGLTTALILSMKNTKNLNTYKLCRVIAWCVIVMIFLLTIVSLCYNGVFKNDIIYKIIRSAGFFGTLGTFMINWKKE